MKPVKSKIGYLLIAACLATLIAVPLYSYAIDYTTAGDKESADSGYTAGGIKTEKKGLSMGGAGLEKVIREPRIPDLNQSPENIISQTTEILKEQRAANEVSDSNEYIEEKIECLPEDRLKISETNDTLKKYSDMMGDAYKTALEIKNMSPSSVTSGTISKAKNKAEKAQELLGDNKIFDNFGLYERCGEPLPDYEFLPIPHDAISMFAD